MIADIVVGIIIASLLIGAIFYMRNQKKKGVACSGCPHAGTCARKMQGGCGH